MNPTVEELKTFKGNSDFFKQMGEGYRIVYYYPDGHYYVGAISKSIEGFMINFCDTYPILSEDEIPRFISTTDLLDRYLIKVSNIDSVALYKTNGELVERRNRNAKKNTF